jgi:hypothetical protein
VNRFFHRDDRRWEIRWVGERNGGYAPKGIPQIVPTVQPVGLFYWGDHDLVEKCIVKLLGIALIQLVCCWTRVLTLVNWLIYFK